MSVAAARPHDRTLAGAAAACAALVFVVVASSAWLRLVPGAACPAGGCEGFTAADLVRLAHRVAAMGVTVLALLVAALAWKTPPAWGRRLAAAAMIALVAVLAVVGRQSAGATAPAIVLTNLLGGLVLLALAASLAAAARPAGARPGSPVTAPAFTTTAFAAAAFALAAAIGTGALATALPRHGTPALGTVHLVLSWTAFLGWGVLALSPAAPARAKQGARIVTVLLAALAALAVAAPAWALTRWLHNLLASATLVAALAATFAAANAARARAPQASRLAGGLPAGP